MAPERDYSGWPVNPHDEVRARLQTAAELQLAIKWLAILCHLTPEQIEAALESSTREDCA